MSRGNAGNRGERSGRERGAESGGWIVDRPAAPIRNSLSILHIECIDTMYLSFFQRKNVFDLMCSTKLLSGFAQLVQQVVSEVRLKRVVAACWVPDGVPNCLLHSLVKSATTKAEYI
jgi:hypothetical protein